MRDARRLGGPISPRQLGAHMASILGSGAEDCLVLPAPGLNNPNAGANAGPEDPLPMGKTVEEVAQALRIVTGEGMGLSARSLASGRRCARLHENFNMLRETASLSLRAPL
jgi:hypothetical protein